jgi:hypothetical protein
MLCDLTISKHEKLTQNYQSSDYGYSITLKDIPEEDIAERSLETRIKITRFLCNSEVMDSKKPLEAAIKEIETLEKHLLDWREKHGNKRIGSKEANTNGVVTEKTT